MRGSDPDAAVYYLAAMLEGGEDPRFIARRMVILASEDVGNADPRALAGRRRRRARARARRPAGGAAQPRAGRDLPRPARRSRTRARSRSGRRARTCARAGTCGRRRCSATRTTGREEARPRRGLRLPARRPARASSSTTSRRSCEGGGTIARAVTAKRRRRRVAIETGTAAPDFDLEVDGVRARPARPTSAAAATSCSSSIRSRSRPSARKRRAISRRTSPPSRTRTPTSSSSPATPPPSRQAWKEQLGLTYTLASDFWPHGEAARAYGVFDEERGRAAPRHVPHRQGAAPSSGARERRRHAPRGARLAGRYA